MDGQASPVRTKAYLIDESVTSVVWMNEAAAAGGAEPDIDVPAPVDEAIPMVDRDATHEALHAVAETGAPAHLSADFVSTSRGTASLTTSIYRLPDGRLLVLEDTTFRVAPRGRAR